MIRGNAGEYISELGLLSSRTTHLLCSGSTRSIYVDDDQRGHIFYDQDDVMRYMNGMEDEVKQRLKLYPKEMVGCDQRELQSSAFRAGAVKFHIHKPESVPVSVNISETACYPDYYNNKLNAVIASLKAHPTLQNLKRLGDCHLLVPAKIIEIDNGLPTFRYPVTSREDDPDEILYVGLSDLRSYDSWASKCSGYQPLELKFRDLVRICKHHGILINPINDGNWLFLGVDMIKNIFG